MSQDVYIKSGELPRYFQFGNDSNNKPILFTTTVQASQAIYKESPWSTFQVIGSAATTVTIQATNEVATAEGSKANWITIATITLAGAGCPLALCSC
jgi:hypothetical protein